MMNVSTFHKNGTGSTLSSLGVDGNVSSCAITANGINGWWMAKLHSHKNIHKMYIITGRLVYWYHRCISKVKNLDKIQNLENKYQQYKHFTITDITSTAWLLPKTES